MARHLASSWLYRSCIVIVLCIAHSAKSGQYHYQQVTGLPPVMWGPSIIGFGTSHYVYETGREGDMPAAAFSPRKANMTFYVGDGFEGAAELYARLGKHKKSVACLYVNKLDDIDLDVLREIIARDYSNQ